MKKTILIIYHSGAGSTKTIAELYQQLLEQLCPGCEVSLVTISLKRNYEDLHRQDAVIMGFPTYHSQAPASMKQFVGTLPVMSGPKRLFLFTTYGLYPANSLRYFGKELKKKGFALCGTVGYRAPATDAALLLPKIPLLMEYEKNTAAKLLKDVQHILKCLDEDVMVERIPRFKVYTMLNYPNQYFGKKVKHTLKVVADNCVHCQRCIDGCFLSCWKSGETVPVFDGTHCEHCFRCIHHCPGNAIVLTKNTQARVKLTPQFYAKKKSSLEEQVNQMLSK